MIASVNESAVQPSSVQESTGTDLVIAQNPSGEINPRKGRTGRKSGHGSDILRKHPEKVKVFLNTLEFAGNVYVAAARAGISLGAVHTWMMRGKHQEAPILTDFWRSCEKAMANFELRQLNHIHNAASAGDAKAAMWLLERLIPSRYMKRELHQHTGADGGPIVVQVEWPDGGGEAP